MLMNEKLYLISLLQCGTRAADTEPTTLQETETRIDEEEKPVKVSFTIGQDKQTILALNCEYFRTRYFLHMLWVLRRTVSLRRSF